MIQKVNRTRLTLACLLAWSGLSAARAEEATIAGAGQGDPEYRAAVYRPSDEAKPADGEPIRLGTGPHLFLDDYLVGKAVNLKRRVRCPVRDPAIRNPIVTGKEDLNFQPYMTVIRDPRTGRFRIWYGVRTEKRDEVRSHLATMESEDGIHWLRPPRVLEDPAFIQFGCSVLDEGAEGADASERFKFAWHDGKGLRVATSADGLVWKPMTPSAVLIHSHDINNLFFDPLRKRYVGTVSVYETGPTWQGKRRVTMQSASADLRHWEKARYVLTPDDATDPPETQFYAMDGHLVRGRLWIAMVKVLHDNERAEGTPEGSFGVGHTQLAWTRDGEHWFRDQTPFFEPDAKAGAWDHAHAWIGCQVLVGDEVYLYYAGYQNGHKVNRFEERQIGLLRIPRDRYVSRDADGRGGTLTTRPVILEASRMTVNAQVHGQLRLRLLDAGGKPVPGFDAADCRPPRGDAVALPVAWASSLEAVKGKPVRIEFQMKDAELYGFDLVE